MADHETVGMDADARRTIARLTADTLPRLIERLTNSELGELEVRDEGWRIRLRRPLTNGAAPVAARAQPSDAHHDRVASVTRSHHSPRPEASRGVVTSPAVGYFVARDGVVVGIKVGRGDTIGHVDVLGVRQEVVAPIEGSLAAMDVEAGQAIEYGQPIARIDAHAPAEMMGES